MKKISHDQIPMYLKAAAVADINVCFVGPIGVGKTQAIEEYAESEGAHLITLILSALDPSQALGIPVRVDKEVDGKTYPVLESAVPSWVLECLLHEKVVLFLDELLTAAPETSNPFLNFLTTKKVGGIDLSHVQIVFATNVEQDSAGFQLANNLLDRLCTFEVGVDIEKVSSYLEKKHGVQELEPGLIGGHNDFGAGSFLYEPRVLSARNFEKLTVLSNNAAMQALTGAFYEGMTNIPKTTPALKRLNLNLFKQHQDIAIDANLRSLRSQQGVEAAVGRIVASSLSRPFNSESEARRAIQNTIVNVAPRANITTIFMDHIMRMIADEIKIS